MRIEYISLIKSVKSYLIEAGKLFVIKENNKIFLDGEYLDFKTKNPINLHIIYKELLIVNSRQNDTEYIEFIDLKTMTVHDVLKDVGFRGVLDVTNCLLLKNYSPLKSRWFSYQITQLTPLWELDSLLGVKAIGDESFLLMPIDRSSMAMVDSFTGEIISISSSNQIFNNRRLPGSPSRYWNFDNKWLTFLENGELVWFYLDENLTIVAEDFISMCGKIELENTSSGYQMDKSNHKLIQLHGHEYSEVHLETGRFEKFLVPDMLAEGLRCTTTISFDDKYINFLDPRTSTVGIIDREDFGLRDSYTFDTEGKQGKYGRYSLQKVELMGNKILVRDNAGFLHFLAIEE